MTQEPYRSARRVFWTMDNGSSHRGQACVDHIGEQWPTIVPVHTPVHASWLNQVEIYFSILQRKALTPNDFPSLEALQERLLGFARYYEAIAQPFEWKFTRKDLDSLLHRIDRAHDQANSPYSQPRRIRVRTYDPRALSLSAISGDRRPKRLPQLSFQDRPVRPSTRPCCMPC